MKILRRTQMNEKDLEIVEKMITYVEEIERDIQAAKTGKYAKTKAVGNILKELERQIKNADKKY